MHLNASDWAALAVIIDSVVTCFVGWRLNRTARQETAKAAQTVQPVIAQELANAANALIPLITTVVKDKLEKKEAEEINVHTGTLRSIERKHSAG